jgi:hypothetical protein
MTPQAARRSRRRTSSRLDRPVQTPEPRRFVWPLRLCAAVLVVVGVVPLANLIAVQGGLPWYSTAVSMWLRWGGGLAVAAIAVAFAAPQRVEMVAKTLDRSLLAPRPALFLLIVGTAILQLSLYFGWTLLGLQATAGDEFAQRWQASLLASGHLSARAEAHPEFFSTLETLQVDGRWFSHFPIGGPAFLALGLLVGAPWLVNPLLTVLGAFAVYRFVGRTMDERSARLSVVLFALSPYVLFMGGSEMNHVATLTASWVALAALPTWASGGPTRARSIAALIIGLAIGVAIAVRPYDGALLALAIGTFQLSLAWRDPSLRRSLVLQCAAGAIPVGAVLFANAATTGHPFAFAYDVLNGPEHRPGFHLTPLGWVHTPRRGLYAISAYLLKLDMMLLGWPVPAILVAAGGLFAIKRGSRWDALLLAVLFSALAGYLAYWGESYFMGPRFLFTVAPILLIYTARFPTALREHLTHPGWRAAALLVPSVWLLSAWVLPADIDRMFGVTTLASTAVLSRSAGPAVDHLVHDRGVTNALVLVQESWHGRLSARLRALGVRPLQAEEIVKSYDACTLQRALDTAARQGSLASTTQLDSVSSAVNRDPPAARLQAMTTIDQIALVPGRPLHPACETDYSTARSTGITLAELLQYTSVDRAGRLAGPVVYARDLGVANEQLRARFGDRHWLRLRLTKAADGMRVELEPYVPPSTSPPAITDSVRH